MAARTTVRLPDDLLKHVRRKAAAERRSLSALIEDALRRVVNEPLRGGQGRRLLPPVSTATGGPRPGIDLSDTDALQELDDLGIAEQSRLDEFRRRLAGRRAANPLVAPADVVRAERDRK
jgi:Arc/MetJ-type ribon-helix-helix transcriptional regulator